MQRIMKSQMLQFSKTKIKIKISTLFMVSDRAKNPGGPTTDKAKRSPPLESIPHRPRKRSLSTMLTAKDEFEQEVSREQAEATRILTKTPLLPSPLFPVAIPTRLVY